MWLTPAQLTVPEGSHNIRFSMLAEFTDGTYGDVTNWSPWQRPSLNRPEDRTFVHATASPNPLVIWGSRAVGAMDVAPKDRSPQLQLGGSERPDPGDLRAGAPNPSTARGRAVGGPKWDTKVTLEHIAGPGVVQIGTVPNVLILGDGFKVGGGADIHRPGGPYWSRRLHSSTPERARST